MSEAKLRQECKRLGARRRRLIEEEQRLAADTRRVLHAARGTLSIKEAATLAGLSRSTAYTVYLA